MRGRVGFILGPVTLATRVLQREVRPDSLRCVRGEAGR